jgi:hypothetical protein
MIAGMNRAVIKQLDDFERSAGKAAELAKGIEEWGSPKITINSRSKGKDNKKSPDKTYGHEDCKSTHPGLVIEVAYSQDASELFELAKKYIEGSNGETRTVVGIDIDYKHTPGGYAKFLVWHAGKEKGATKAILSDPGTVSRLPHLCNLMILTSSKQKFRNNDGEEVSGVSLRLLLTDFVCPKIANSFVDVKDSINISAADLCKALAKGEEQHFHDKGKESWFFYFSSIFCKYF